MKIYIDNEFKCHLEHTEGLRKADAPIFDGKCREYIEGMRFVPEGEHYTNDGNNTYGEAVFPWKPMDELEKAQTEWEHEQLSIITAERNNLLKYIEEEEFTTDENGNHYHREVGIDGEIHLVLIESYTGELFQ